MHDFDAGAYGSVEWWVVFAPLVAIGYLGYAEVGSRRITDRRFRLQIVRCLDELEHKIEERHGTVPRDVSGQDLLQDSVQRIEALREEVRTDPASAPFFEAPRLSEKELEGLYAYDRQILEQTERLERLTEAIALDTTRLQGEWREEVERLGRLVGERRQFISHAGD